MLFYFPITLYRLYRSITGSSRTAFELRQWAEEEGMEIALLKPCNRLPESAWAQFPHRMLMSNFRYFQISVIDRDHVRRSGFARVHNETSPLNDPERIIDFAWLTSEQLNWRDRPPRLSARLPGDRAEGWFADHTGAHELRWYSVGTPTELVKDGSVESRDPPPGPLAEAWD